jgi:hypothetical protein
VAFLISCIDEPEVKTKVAQQIGLKALVEQLSSPNPAVQKSAAVALGHYAGQEENQQVRSLSLFSLFLCVLTIFF